MGKTYLARVHGHPPEDRFECHASISRRPLLRGTRVICSDGQPAHTRFDVVQRLGDGSSLLTVTPRTGRTNQIRLHLWHLGWPIVNDPVWGLQGSVQMNRTLAVDEPPLCLQANSLSVTDTSGLRREFRVPPPVWWTMGVDEPSPGPTGRISSAV